jgi:hypothetical protein
MALLAPQADAFVEAHSGELLILVLFLVLVAGLIVLVPQLLRAHLRKAEMVHEEHLRALEQGQIIPEDDQASRAAGRTAMLVPMVVIIAAATVTCFLVVCRSDNVFAVALALWTVAGVVSLAAITGGVALIGRLAQLRQGEQNEVVPENPFETADDATRRARPR